MPCMSVFLRQGLGSPRLDNGLQTESFPFRSRCHGVPLSQNDYFFEVFSVAASLNQQSKIPKSSKPFWLLH